MNCPIYKIKDSVDIFLSDKKYVMVYYMNTRQRKSFKVNESTVHLLEIIDGEKTLIELQDYMHENYGISVVETESVINELIKNRIVTEKIVKQNILLPNDLQRYDRQINYFTEFLNSDEQGLQAQRKLMESRVIIFGCGAVGGDIALELAMAGVQNIGLFDFDIVEESDVSRHMYYSNIDNGESKVYALRQQILKIDKRINVNCIERSMQPEDDIENIINKYDFVVNTLDEPYIGYTSSKISRICIKYEIPHYIAGGFDAHLASTGELIIPYVTPCVECYALHFKKTLTNWKPKKHPVKQRYKKIGGLASMTLFSASFATIEIIKYIAGLVDMKKSFKVRGELLFDDMKLTYLDVDKNSNCPVCGKRGMIK